MACRFLLGFPRRGSITTAKVLHSQPSHCNHSMAPSVASGGMIDKNEVDVKSGTEETLNVFSPGLFNSPVRQGPVEMSLAPLSG